MNTNMNVSASLVKNTYGRLDGAEEAINFESKSAMALINAIPKPTANLPANLGQDINITA